LYLYRQPTDIKHNVTTLPLGIAQVAASLIEEKIECRGLDLLFSLTNILFELLKYEKNT